MRTVKIAVSMDPDLLHQLDEWVEKKKFPNRSRAVQDAIREKINGVNGLHEQECLASPSGPEPVQANELGALRIELEQLRQERDHYLDAFYAVKAAEALKEPMPTYEELVRSSEPA